MLTILRTVPNRSFNHLIKYADYICVDRNFTGCKSFLDQLYLMQYLNDDILFLEDDIQISDEQYKFIINTITAYSDKLINFSSRRVYDGMCSPFTFQFTQCVYFPKRIVNHIVDNLDVAEFLSFSHYDIALRKLIDEDYLSIYYTKAMTDMCLHSVMKYFK